jgi:hypothetical protein
MEGLRLHPSALRGILHDYIHSLCEYRHPWPNRTSCSLKCRHPERSEGSLYFLFTASPVHPLSIIAKNRPPKTCQAPNQPKPAPILHKRIAHEFPSIL